MTGAPVLFNSLGPQSRPMPLPVAGTAGPCRRGGGGRRRDRPVGRVAPGPARPRGRDLRCGRGGRRHEFRRDRHAGRRRRARTGRRRPADPVPREPRPLACVPRRARSRSRPLHRLRHSRAPSSWRSAATRWIACAPATPFTSRPGSTRAGSAPRRCCDLEPGLRPNVTGGIFCPGDHQVDPRLTLAALRAAFLATRRPSVRRRHGRTARHVGRRRDGRRGGRAALPRLDHRPGERRRSAASGLLPAGLHLPLRPLKGQSMALRARPQFGRNQPLPIDHVVWTSEVHLAPKADGRMIVGATVEEAGFDPHVTAGGLYALLEGVRRILPGVEEMAVESVWAGFRPTTEDDAPALGRLFGSGPRFRGRPPPQRLPAGPRHGAGAGDIDLRRGRGGHARRISASAAFKQRREARGEADGQRRGARHPGPRLWRRCGPPRPSISSLRRGGASPSRATARWCGRHSGTRR